jgi:hypothetical protein
MSCRSLCYRAFVSLPDGIWKIIDEELKGTIGGADSEIIRNIVVGFLTDNGYLSSSQTPKGVSSVRKRGD